MDKRRTSEGPHVAAGHARGTRCTGTSAGAARHRTTRAIGWLLACGSIATGAALSLYSDAFAAAGASGDSPAPLLQVKLDPAADAAMPLARQIDVSGVWPNDCTPQIDGVALAGADLTISARFPTTGCDASHPKPYQLQVSPSAVTGLPQLPAQVYRTQVFLAATNAAPDLAAFTLLDATAAHSAPQPESGFWWSQASKETGAALAGSGLSLEFQDHRVAAGFLGFDATGNATWYFGSAPLEGRVAHVPLVSLSRGDAPFVASDSRPLAEPGPRIEIQFLSPTQALAWLVRDRGNGTLDVRALSISRSLFAAKPTGSAWSGRWVLVRAGDVSARVFDLSELSVEDADSFHLGDPASGARLDCRIDATAHTPTPDLCTLTAFPDTVANFDQIGVDHLKGRSADGTMTQLVRVPD